MFEGRVLGRPDEEIVDQGAAFDISTLFTRRRMLGVIGAGLGSVVLAACGSSSSTATPASATGNDSTVAGEIPEETNGPYPADGTGSLNVLKDSGIVRSDITSSLDGGAAVKGVPLTLTFNLVNMTKGDSAFKGAALYAWQCNALGQYSMYTSGVTGETFLRGIQVADSDGNLTFKTIVPGCYTGRWPHIHFEVYPDLDSATDVSKMIATSQLAFPADMLHKIYELDEYSGSTRNLAGVGTKISDDLIFGAGDWHLQVPTVKGSVTSGYTATLTAKIDTKTKPVLSGSGSGPGGAPPSGAGAPPSGAGAGV